MIIYLIICGLCVVFMGFWVSSLEFDNKELKKRTKHLMKEIKDLEAQIKVRNKYL